MSETIIEEDLNNNSEEVEETNNDENNEHENNEKKVKHVEIELKSNKTQRSDKTKFERAKDSKQRAIDAFKQGHCLFSKFSAHIFLSFSYLYMIIISLTSTI